MPVCGGRGSWDRLASIGGAPQVPDNTSIRGHVPIRGVDIGRCRGRTVSMQDATPETKLAKAPTDSPETREDERPAAVAMARWLAALNARGEPTAVSAAVHEEARVERCGVGAHAGVVVEEIIGPTNIGRWMALSPPGTRFETTTTPEATRDADGTGFDVGYRVAVAGFENTGRWRFRLGPVGEIMWLKHVPTALEGTTVGEVRDPAEAWRKYVVQLPESGHHHDHAHHDHHGHGH
jgi:hypothetical protein